MTGFLTPTHILLILLVMLVLFGAKRLPELGRSLGTGLREFKHSINPPPIQEPAALTAAPTSDRITQQNSIEQPTASAPSHPAD